MGGGTVHNAEVCLNAGVIQRFCRTSSHDQILLLGQPLLDSLGNITAASAIWIWNIDGTVVEIVPAKHLLPPEFEGVQKMKIRAIGQGQLVLAEIDPSLDRPVIIVVTGRLDQSVDPVHLHGDLFADWNIPSDDCVSECAIIAGDGGVR